MLTRLSGLGAIFVGGRLAVLLCGLVRPYAGRGQAYGGLPSMRRVREAQEFKRLKCCRNASAARRRGEIVFFSSADISAMVSVLPAGTKMES